MLGDIRPARRRQALTAASLRAALLAGALALGACAGGGRHESDQHARSVAAGVHVVAPGETLYGIASRYGLDYRDLARWNRLGDGTLIYPGERLRLSAAGAGTDAPPPDPVATPAPADWQWPTAGPVEAAFGTSQRTASGVLIGGALGQPIRAAADGEVVYAGTGLAGYGQLLIVRHNVSWLSAYGHCQRLLVGEGQRVRAGQDVALMGEGPGRRPLVHFEIRRDGEPVNPLSYLPQHP